MSCNTFAVLLLCFAVMTGLKSKLIVMVIMFQPEEKEEVMQCCCQPHYSL